MGKLLILTAHPNEEELFLAMRYGVMGYLSSYSELETLLCAINAVRQEHFLVTSDVLSDPVLLRRKQMASRKALQAPPVAQEPVPNGLKEQEQQLLVLAASGKTNKEIAALLGWTPERVRRWFTTIYAKLQVSSRTEAVVLAMRHRWIAADTIRSQKEAPYANS